jgi:DNA-binding transcriptional LysR family regulator
MHDSLRSKLQEIEDVVSGSIRVATIYSIGLHVLPPFVKKFMKNFPGVNVHVEYRRPDQVIEDVAGNVMDIGLVAYPARDNRLEVVLLRKDPLVLIASPEHPIARERQVSIGTLNGLKFVSFDRDIPTRKALDKIFKDHEIEVEHVVELDNVETLKRAVEIGSGVAIVPRETVKQEVEGQTLAQIELEGDFSRPLAAIYKKNKVLSPAIRKFIALLKETSD